MKTEMTETAGRSGSLGAAEQRFSIPFMVSFMGHVILCLLFIGLPRLGSINKQPPRVVNIQLVSAAALPQESEPEPKTRSPEPKTTPPPAPKPEPSAAAKPKPKDAVSLAPKKEIEKKRSMKHMTYKRERVVESAIKNIEKRVESSRPDPIQQAIDQIQANLKDEERSASTAKGAGVGGKGKPTSDAQLAYYAEIAVAIQKNWAFSEQLAGGETGLYNEVVIKIMRNGKIDNVWFDRRSGNRYFDESTRKAILKSDPLPPMPEGIAKTFLELGIRFTPEGLR